ncbi:heat shock protein 70 kDa [Trifolium pratense]|uniref:Heat shock protein 70 kDa n=1 Tax=Trifolium pratense TaxID=57577 RepID=A0A2K3NR55_TRIPR|nr:heat shock protein 70 kDa [Trifolium pratense]
MALFRCGIQEAITRLSSQTHVEVDLDLGYGLKIRKAVTQDEFEKERNFMKILSLDAALHGAAMTGVIALGVDNPFGNLEVFDFPFTPLAIGIRANGNNFVPVIPNNTLVPTMRHVVFTTIHDKQAAALITVYEGDAQKAEENHHLMEYFKITDIPEASKGVPEIHVRMDLDHKNRITEFADGQIGLFDDDTMDLVTRLNKE